MTNTEQSSDWLHKPVFMFSTASNEGSVVIELKIVREQSRHIKAGSLYSTISFLHLTEGVLKVILIFNSHLSGFVTDKK